ncbi:MAG: alpha/beta hydrolase [Bacteroidota bacterium]
MRKKCFCLFVFIHLVFSVFAQKVPYGNNPATGNYFNHQGVKLYYEVYGKGSPKKTPILMLHGGVYGYINEFEFLIPKLAEKHQVICLATRGHGKSEIGNEPFTFEQRAGDAYALIQHLQLDSTIILGFSDGGSTALKLAALYPHVVKKAIAMGVGDVPKGSRKDTFHYSAKQLLKDSKEYFEGRLKLMPEPDRWDESLQMLSKLYNEEYLSSETFEKIKCPVLLMNGEYDEYQTLDALMQCYKSIPNAHLSVIPMCGHVIFYCNFQAVWESMKRFIE